MQIVLLVFVPWSLILLGWNPYQGEEYYRARLGDGDKTKPFPKEKMGAPPPEKTLTGGRANPPGIPFLYLANNRETAIAETRPWIGASVSLGRFEPERDLNIIACNQHRNVSALPMAKLTTRESWKDEELEERIVQVEGPFRDVHSFVGGVDLRHIDDQRQHLVREFQGLLQVDGAPGLLPAVGAKRSRERQRDDEQPRGPAHREMFRVRIVHDRTSLAARPHLP